MILMMIHLISARIISLLLTLLLGFAPSFFGSATPMEPYSVAPQEDDDQEESEDEDQDDDDDEDQDDDEDADDEDADDEDADDEEEGIETAVVEKQTIRVYQNLEGVFEATETHEIETDFEQWSELEIKTIIEQGKKVKKGDVLVEFDTEEIDKAMVESEFELKNAQLDMEDAELTKKQLDITHELDLKIAKREWEQAGEDNTYYWEFEVPQRDKDLEFDIKTAGFSLEYNKDELDQLEKMYTEDELTEESEEIVLKRARRGVESSEWHLEMSMERFRRRKEILIPRQDQRHKDTYRQSELEHERAMIELAASKERAEIAYKRARISLEETEKNHKELSDDLKKMTIKAPAAGTLFYGQCDRGTWSGNEVLEEGDSMSSDSVVMTIVNDEMMIRTSVEEDNISLIEEKMKGNVRIPAIRETARVAIKSVGTIPMADGGYDCEILISGDAPDGILPGMNCKTAFMAYENKDALVAPESAVFSDDDGVTHYVFIVEDGEAERKEVVVGHTANELTEILKGLDEGDEITTEKQSLQDLPQPTGRTVRCRLWSTSCRCETQSRASAFLSVSSLR